MTVYFISGQAADEKLFENITLPSHINLKYVHWIEPLKNETLLHYCERLSEQIDTSGDFALVGVSLGGMVSVELNKILHPRQTIIISSISTRQELRPLSKFIGFLRIHRIFPAKFYKWHPPLLNWFFGAKTKREKELLRLYAEAGTKNYMKWAVNEIVNWKNEQRPANLLHIHGTKDRIFPHARIKADSKIKGGTHLMIHNRAEEISKLLVERIKCN